MGQPVSPEPADERQTTRGFEILHWGVACGRVATGALVLAGLIAVVGLANPARGVVAYVFLAPLALGTALIFGFMLVGASVRGFIHLYLGRTEWGPRHRSAVVRATTHMCVAAFAGFVSVVASVGPLSSLTSASTMGASSRFPPEALVRAFVVADALALVASAVAATALLEAVRHFLPERVKQRGPLLVLMAVSYPLFSLVTEGLALGQPGSSSPAAALWFLSISTGAIGSYLALRLASTMLDEACLRSVLERRGEVGSAPLPPAPG